jgi:hypothetical protein
MASHPPRETPTRSYAPAHSSRPETGAAAARVRAWGAALLHAVWVICVVVLFGLPYALLTGLVVVVMLWGLPLLAAAAWLGYGLHVAFGMLQHGYSGWACAGVIGAALFGWALPFYVTRFVLAGVILCCSRGRIGTGTAPVTSAADPLPAPPGWRRTIRRRILVQYSSDFPSEGPWDVEAGAPEPHRVLLEETIVEEHCPSAPPQPMTPPWT